MRSMYKNGMRVGVLLAAICVGVFIGGGQDPVALLGAIVFGLFAGGQYWAYKNNIGG